MSHTRPQRTSRPLEEDEAPAGQGRGLPPSQLALILSLNALLSLLISVAVVLVAGPYLTANAPRLDPLSLSLPGGSPIVDLPPASPSAPAAALTTATPRGPEFYTVQPGDSLSTIAIRYDVSLNDLMVTNGLDDPDYVQVGQVLVIPLDGIPNTAATPTAEVVTTPTDIPFEPPTPLPADVTLPPEPAVTVGPSATPTETPTPIPTSTAPSLDQVIVTITRVVGAGDLEQEAVVLLNEGPGVNLTGWTLAGLDLEAYVFPNLFLWSGGSIRIHTRDGANSASDLYWGRTEPAWPSGTELTLKDPTGGIVSAITVP
jgi:LysM repeat protein